MADVRIRSAREDPIRRLRIGIVDLVTKSARPSLYGRLMNANFASIMPQVVAVWCEQEGHRVKLVCYTGVEDLLQELPADLDVVFVGAYHLIPRTSYSFSWRAIARRIPATRTIIPKWLNVVRATSSEGFGRIRYNEAIRRLLDKDRSLRAFLEGESDELPELYAARIRRELGPAYPLLPAGALEHDPNAYLHAAEPTPASATAPRLGALRG